MTLAACTAKFLQQFLVGFAEGILAVGESTLSTPRTSPMHFQRHGQFGAHFARAT